MNKELVTRFSAQFSLYERNILQDLLAKHDMSPAQFAQIATTQLKKSVKMQQAFEQNPASLFASILLCAELGLNPSEDIGEFYFVPFKGSIKPMLGYKGIVTLFMRTGKVKWITTELVYQDDDFEYELGLEPRLGHIPNTMVPKRNENIMAAYAVAKLDDGEKVFKVMTRAEIMDIAQNNGNSDMYFSNAKDPQNWMARKTVLKQLAKLLPKDYYGKQGLSLDDQMEGGGYVSMDSDEVVIKQQKNVAKGKSKGLYTSFEELDSEESVQDVSLSNV
jgi:recombination protein RecT